MKKLTVKQIDVLEFIRSYKQENGYAPTGYEIQHAFGWKSETAAYTHLKALHSKGAINLARGISRGITIVGEYRPDAIKMEKQLKQILMLAQAGVLGDASSIVRDMCIDGISSKSIDNTK